MQPEVLLVGAGPGAADLLTVRAQRAIAQAEALLYDALVEPEVIALAPRRCLRVRTGKRSGGASMRQDEINALMAKLAQRGLKVVRLKGGDPSVFGRSGEERAYLEARGISVQIVPGVTAASAAAAQFAFPLTHRGEARQLAFVTARIEDGRVHADGWPNDPSATLAIYMGRDRAEPIVRRLIEDGRSPFTPALAVENAGRPDARLFKGDIASLPALIEAAAPKGPVVLVIGQVAAMAREEKCGGKIAEERAA